MPFRINRRRQSLALIPSIIGGIAIIVMMQQPRLHNLKQSAKTLDIETLERETELQRYRLNLLQKSPSLGFDNLLADWVFLSFLGYFGDEEARKANGYALSLDYFDAIIEHDPRFLRMYLFLFVSGAAYAGMPEETVALMEKGLQSMSHNVPETSYYVWRYKGFIELLYLGKPLEAQKSFEKAAEWASTYSDSNSKVVAQMSRRTAEFLATNPDSKSAQISSWLGILEEAVDTRTRENAITNIKRLGGQVTITPSGSVRVLLPPETENK